MAGDLERTAPRSVNIMASEVAAAIASYVPLDQLANATSFWDSVADYQGGVIVFVGHCLFCASLAPEFKSKYLVHFMVRVWAARHAHWGALHAVSCPAASMPAHASSACS